MITPYNILRHELVGLGLKAKTGKKTYEGTVEDETENTIIIKTQNGVKRLVKESSKMEFLLPGDAIVEVEGKFLQGAAHDRIKKKHRIRF
jgi:RNase P/RNase MRP subunit p29